MVKLYAFNNGKIEETSDPACPIYLYIDPDEKEFKHLVEDLNIDEHTLHSSLDPNELARIEFEPKHVAVITKRPKRYSARDNFLFKVESVGMFVFADRLIIVLSEEIPIFSGRQFNQVATIQELVLKIIYRSTFHFEEHIKVISMCSDNLELGINTSINNRQLLNMFTLEKSLVFYLEAIGSNGRIIDKLKVGGARLVFTKANMDFLDDIAIENTQCYEMAQIYSQVIASLMDARASIISNNLNVMMKNLNALVIAVAVPSFFAGVGGMSEFSSMIGFSHWTFGYPIFLLFMLALGVTTFYVIKKVEQFWR